MLACIRRDASADVTLSAADRLPQRIYHDGMKDTARLYQFLSSASAEEFDIERPREHVMLRFRYKRHAGGLPPPLYQVSQCARRSPAMGRLSVYTIILRCARRRRSASRGDDDDMGWSVYSRFGC